MRRLLLADAWWARPRMWVEWFLVANLGFLAVDVSLAHAVNSFEHPAEWIPVGFSIGATLLLLLSIALGGAEPATRVDSGLGPVPARRRIARWLGLLVGWGAIAVGVAGLVWHLKGDFFEEQTLRNLVYTAPFAAPLAYTGLGLLALLDRMVDPRTEGLEWARWVVLLASGGFLGNFVLSLADHAQNGFFYPSEWIAVVAGAVGFGFLIAQAVVPESLSLLVMASAVMAVQVVVSLLGFYLHARGNLGRGPGSLWDHFVYGAPVFAPLLFADLALLALLGSWGQARAFGGSEALETAC